MEERYIAAVDLGSSKIALTVAKISGEDVQILYYRERPSDGIRNSAVFNPQRASAPIKEAIAEAENELKIKIMQVVVGLPRCDVRQEIANAKVDRTDPEESISVEEVEGLKSLAQDEYPLQNPDKEELYGAIAQSFSDDENFQLIESDIIGMISQTFEGNFKLFIGKKSSVKTIDKVFNALGIAIAKKYFTPGTISKAVLKDDEMENGVALIDFGGGATSVTIYKGRILRYYAAIPFGGAVITSDIRSECSISESLAENLKLAYGACQPDRLQSLDEKIIQIEEEEMGYKQIPVKYLSEIITAREKEIIDAILYHIQESGLADSLRSGVVITGGGANMANLANYIKELSGYNVRKGIPRHLFSAHGCQGVYETSATGSLGMILAAKADGLINCIDAPEFDFTEAEMPAESHYSPMTDTEKDMFSALDNIPEDNTGVGSEVVNEEETPDEEPVQENLFGEAEVPIEKTDKKSRKEDKGKKQEQKEKKPKKNPFKFGRIKWLDKVGKTIGDLYDGVGESVKEAMEDKDSEEA
ncbi:MAG: cell division protein FtsA [Bacteroidales bacterium]|nr:cell division protein FtsA [Bacteroidales bacterium]MBQ9711486.1 cell division protein FtsA [Bacteroidales bacterium]MBR1435148.1 cell division protein FtsA [Bacteroidales bacterium]